MLELRYGLQFFDPKADYGVCWKQLPHWFQAGSVVFITWRTHDSLPLSVLRRLDRECNNLFKQFEIDPSNRTAELAKLPVEVRRRVQMTIFENLDDHLGNGHGACALRDPTVSALVAESLKKFDGDRYCLTDFVVMPNHVHLLAAFRSEEEMLTQCSSWKRFTARQINAHLGTKGEFWQTEAFDHLVRSPEAFEYYRRYIADNPRRARLPSGSFRHFSKDLTTNEMVPSTGSEIPE